jgi:AraC-like DNA-binding protein
MAASRELGTHAMNSRSFWVKGNRDDYAHFLAQTHNAELLAVSTPFRFEIKSREFSSLVLRRVSVSGHCSNSYLLEDTFIGLMIALPGSGFSTKATDHLDAEVDLKRRDYPSIHCHFACDERVYSHHLDSHVIYIRIEAARFLLELAFRGLGIASILALDGKEASSNLVRLCEPIEKLIDSPTSTQEQDQWADQLLVDLMDELQVMATMKADRSSRSAGRHVIASLQWLDNQSAATAINLDQLAKAINVTPRTIQTSFQNRFKMSPMRWLKLWRLSQLHRLLFHNNGQLDNAATLIMESGLGSITTANKSYRAIYGRTPQEELDLTNHARDNTARGLEYDGKTVYTIDQALELLGNLKLIAQDQHQLQPLITLRVKLNQASVASNF